MPTTAYQDLKKDVIARRIKLLEAELELKKLLENCPHEEVREIVTYYSGNVHDKPFSRIHDECILCNKRYNSRTESPTYYDKD